MGLENGGGCSGEGQQLCGAQYASLPAIMILVYVLPSFVS